MADETEVDVAAIDMTAFDGHAAVAREYVADQRRRGASADARADRIEQADPTAMSPDEVMSEGNRMADALEATTLRLRTLGQDARERLALYEEARSRALTHIQAPTKDERASRADMVPHVAALKEASEYAAIGVEVAQRTCNAFGKILDWRKAQLYTVTRQVDPDRGGRS